MARQAMALSDVISALDEAVDDFGTEARRSADMSDEELARAMVTAAQLLDLFGLVVAVVERATLSRRVGGSRG